MNKKNSQFKLFILKYAFYLRWIKLAAIALLFIATFENSSEYYKYLRYLVFTISIYAIYQEIKLNEMLNDNIYSHRNTKGIIIILFIAIAVFFNPIVPIYFYDKEKWITIDLFSAVVFGFSLTADYWVFDELRHRFLSALTIHQLKLNSALTIQNLLSIAEKKELELTNKELNYLIAIDLYTKVIEIDSTNSSAYYKRGLLYISFNCNSNWAELNIDNTIRDFKKSAQLGGKDAYLNFFIGLALFYKSLQPGQDKIRKSTLGGGTEREALREDAVKKFNNQIQTNNSSLAYFLRGGVYIILEEYDKAFEDFERVPNISKHFGIGEDDLTKYFLEDFGKYSIVELVQIVETVISNESDVEN